VLLEERQPASKGLIDPGHSVAEAIGLIPFPGAINIKGAAVAGGYAPVDFS
jgi:hypothetical protein